MRKYDGLEFRLNKRFSNNWSGTASYLYSRLCGNYSGLASSDENGRMSPNVNRYFDNTIMNYDAQRQLRLRAAADRSSAHLQAASASTTSSGARPSARNWFIQSGIPQSTVFRFSGFPVFPNGRNDLGRSPGAVAARPERQPGVQAARPQPHSASGEHRQRVRPGHLDELLPDYHPGAVDAPRQPDGGQAPGAARCTARRGAYDLNARIAAYTGTMRANPFYKTPNVFQGRREIRLQARIMF